MEMSGTDDITCKTRPRFLILKYIFWWDMWGGGGGGRGDGGRTEEWLRVNVKSVASGRIRINTGRWYNVLCT